MKTVKLFVEGGGDSKALRTECRAAFSSFLQKAGLSGHMPRIVASGSRNAAYGDYCTAITNGEDAALLIDSEAAVIFPESDAGYDADNIRSWDPWHHLAHRRSATGESADPWKKPSGALNSDCHLMVQSMESWLLADTAALRSYYGFEFNGNSLPKRSDIENIAKDTVITAFRTATGNTRKGSYDKGNHSFGILATIDPNKVMNHSPWAKRFIVLISEKMRSAR